MVKDTDAMQKALTDISDVDDLIATFLPKMKAYLTVTLKAPWALQRAWRTLECRGEEGLQCFRLR